MGLVSFYATLAVELVSLLAAATCFSVYLVSRRKTFLFAFWAFFFYFFDTVIIFQDSYLKLLGDVANQQSYLILRSYWSVITGAGVFVSVWFAACQFVEERRPLIRWTPAVLFVALSLIVLATDNTSPQGRFVFYAIRACLLFWTLAFLGIRYIQAPNDAEHERMKRYRFFYIAAWILSVSFFAEDIWCFLIAPYNGTEWLAHILGERNYLEELLMLMCAGTVFVVAFQTLNLRYDKPPTGTDEKSDSYIDDNIDLFCKRNKLSKREQEILSYVLKGMDNQSIADQIHVAPSTVKVHVHNILQKTGAGNRQELMREFWRTW